jgi:hypothetical protein
MVIRDLKVTDWMVEIINLIQFIDRETPQEETFGRHTH